MTVVPAVSLSIIDKSSADSEHLNATLAPPNRKCWHSSSSWLSSRAHDQRLKMTRSLPSVFPPVLSGRAIHFTSSESRLIDFEGMVLMENGRLSMFKSAVRSFDCCRARAQQRELPRGSSSQKAVLSPTQTSPIVSLIVDISSVAISRLFGRLSISPVKVCTL
jgi:hypothetical protein